MNRPILLTSDEVQQQAVDAGLPPYAVAVIPGMLQPAGTLHTRHSAKSITLYNSLEVDGAINYLLVSKLTPIIPLLIAPGLIRRCKEATKKLEKSYWWSARSTGDNQTIAELQRKVEDALRSTYLDKSKPCHELVTTDSTLINFMKALDVHTE